MASSSQALALYRALLRVCTLALPVYNTLAIYTALALAPAVHYIAHLLHSYSRTFRLGNVCQPNLDVILLLKNVEQNLRNMRTSKTLDN